MNFACKLLLFVTPQFLINEGFRTNTSIQLTHPFLSLVLLTLGSSRLCSSEAMMISYLPLLNCSTMWHLEATGISEFSTHELIPNCARYILSLAMTISQISLMSKCVLYLQYLKGLLKFRQI